MNAHPWRASYTTQSSHKHRSHMRLWLKSLTAQDCSVIIGRMRIVPSSGPPCRLLAGLFHIFSLPVHHNTKHNLDSTTFSKTTLYTEHLPEPIQSKSSANEPLSHVNYESGRNPRKTSPAGYEPKELATSKGTWCMLLLIVRGLLRRPSLSASPTVTFCSVHIHNVVAKKRDASTALFQRLHGYMREHNVDFIGGDFNMSVFPR